MNEITGGPEGTAERCDAVPDVTHIPLLDMASQEDRVLDAAIRRLVEDLNDGREITAQFGNAP